MAAVEWEEVALGGTDKAAPIGQEVEAFGEEEEAVADKEQELQRERLAAGRL